MEFGISCVKKSFYDIFQNVTFDSILSVPFPEILPSLMTSCKLEDKIGNIVDIYLPFINDLAIRVSQKIEIKEIIQRYVVAVSCDSLLPLLQVLQSHVGISLLVL